MENYEFIGNTSSVRSAYILAADAIGVDVDEWLTFSNDWVSMFEPGIEAAGGFVFNPLVPGAGWYSTDPEKPSGLAWVDAKIDGPVPAYICKIEDGSWDVWVLIPEAEIIKAIPWSEWEPILTLTDDDTVEYKAVGYADYDCYSPITLYRRVKNV